MFVTRQCRPCMFISSLLSRCAWFGCTTAADAAAAESLAVPVYLDEQECRRA